MPVGWCGLYMVAVRPAPAKGRHSISLSLSSLFLFVAASPSCRFIFLNGLLSLNSIFTLTIYCLSLRIFIHHSLISNLLLLLANLF